MPLIDDAIATYEAAARMLSRVLDSRTDLLASGLAALGAQPAVHLFGGYKDVGEALGVCLPSDSRATMSRAEAAQGSPPAIELLTGDLEWMTFEGWVRDPQARTCFVEADLKTGRQITADVFQRSIGPEGTLRDSRPIEWNLRLSGPCVLEVPLDTSRAARHKIVIHLRRPPERMVLRRLAFTALP